MLFKIYYCSVMWWTNETINIWSHIFGLALFVALTIQDLIFLRIHASISDKLIVGAVLICFQVLESFVIRYQIFFTSFSISDMYVFVIPLSHLQLSFRKRL